MLLEELAFLATGAGLHPLEDTALLRVAGADAREWLNGMVTNDVRALDEVGAVETAIVSVKGKLIADAWAYALGAERLVAVPSSARDPVATFLDQYVVMEDVSVSAADELALVSVRGPRAAEIVEAAALGDEARAYRTDRFGVAGLDVVLPRPQAASALDLLVESARTRGGGRVGSDALEIARLRAGRARWGIDIGPSLYPQEAGLGARAVSFKKGCYVGQEVVCTLEMRGHVKRVLARVQLDAEAPPAAGSALTRDGETVGTLTSAVLDPVDRHVIGLASVKLAAAEPGTRLALADGRACEVLDRAC